MRFCETDGCDNTIGPRNKTGQCQSCGRRQYKLGQECAAHGCSRQAAVHDLCTLHYTRQGKGLPVDYERPRAGAVCAYEGCMSPPAPRRLMCNSHYMRLFRYGDAEWSAPQPSSLVRDEFGRKQCIKCSQWLPECDFYKSYANMSADGLRHTCKSCINIKSSDPDQSLRRRALRYGVSVDFIEQMRSDQEDCCAICPNPLLDGKDGFHIDHDHGCCPGQSKSCGKCIRGLLCGGCNMGLGGFRDDISNLESAIRYMAQWIAREDDPAAAVA